MKKHLLSILSSSLLCSSLLCSNTSAMHILEKHGYDEERAQQSGLVSCYVKPGTVEPETPRSMTSLSSAHGGIYMSLHTLGTYSRLKYWEAFCDSREIDRSKKPIVLSLKDFKKLISSNVPGSLIFRGVRFSGQEAREQYFSDILNEGVGASNSGDSWIQSLGSGLYFSTDLSVAYKYASRDGKDWGSIIVGFLVGDPVKDYALTGERAIKSNDKLVLCRLRINVGQRQDQKRTNTTLKQCRNTICKMLGKDNMRKFGQIGIA